MPFYSALTDLQTNAGKPVSQELLKKIKDNFADHESRINTLNASIREAKPISFVVKGGVWIRAMPFNGVDYERIWTPITLTGARLLVIDAGTSGILEVDIKYKRGAGGVWTTIFTTRPSANFSSGSLYLATNAVLSVTSLLAGDLLRLDVITAQTNNNDFQLELPFQAS